jgi:hypothetical protein
VALHGVLWQNDVGVQVYTLEVFALECKTYVEDRWPGKDCDRAGGVRCYRDR